MYLVKASRWALPGPWPTLFNQVGIDVFKLGPFFVSMGLLWLIWLIGLWTKQPWAFHAGVVLSLLTLWYLPVGTFFSVIVLAILVLAKPAVGL